MNKITLQRRFFITIVTMDQVFHIGNKLKNYFLVITALITFQFQNLHAQSVACCGNGICEAGEDSISCPYDCKTKVNTGCFNPLGSYFTSPTWPVSYATAKSNGWCYTIPANPLPSRACFSYRVPNDSVYVSFVIKGCNGNIASINQGTTNGCNFSSFFQSGSGIDSAKTYNEQCGVMYNSIAHGVCGQSAGKMVTVCLFLNPSIVNCPSIEICPVIKCWSENCAVSSTPPGCPPFSSTATVQLLKCADSASGGKITVEHAGCDQNKYTYLWDDVNKQKTATAIGLKAGIYHVTITDTIFKCDTTLQVSIPCPSFNLTVNAKPSKCFGYSNGEATVNNVANCNYTYKWNDVNQQTTVTAIGLNTGTYTVIVSDTVFKCDTTLQVIIPVDPTPIKANAGTDSMICAYQLLSLGASPTASGGTPAYKYDWLPKVFLNDYTVSNPSLQGISESVTYTVVVTDANNCVQKDEVTVKLETCQVTVPNIFTPNADGKNDRFEIAGLSDFPGSQLTVYNRWGQKIFESGNYKNEWDGTEANGNHKVADGTYYFVLLLTSKETKTGFITLLR